MTVEHSILSQVRQLQDDSTIIAEYHLVFKSQSKIQGELKMTAAQPSENLSQQAFPPRTIGDWGKSSPIRVSHKLRRDDLQALFDGDIAVLRVPNFRSGKPPLTKK